MRIPLDEIVKVTIFFDYKEENCDYKKYIKLFCIFVYIRTNNSRIIAFIVRIRVQGVPPFYRKQ